MFNVLCRMIFGLSTVSVSGWYWQFKKQSQSHLVCFTFSMISVHSNSVHRTLCLFVAYSCSFHNFKFMHVYKYSCVFRGIASDLVCKLTFLIFACHFDDVNWYFIDFKCTNVYICCTQTDKKGVHACIYLNHLCYN